MGTQIRQGTVFLLLYVNPLALLPLPQTYIDCTMQEEAYAEANTRLALLTPLEYHPSNLLVLEAAFTRGGLSWHHQGRNMVMFRG